MWWEAVLGQFEPSPQELVKNERGVKGRLLRDSNDQISQLLPAKYVHDPVFNTQCLSRRQMVELKE